MGYESRLYITETPRRGTDGQLLMAPRNGVIYYQVVAEFDLCKVAGTRLSGLFADSVDIENRRVAVEGWRHGIFSAAEGDTLVTEDRYGDPLSPVPLNDLLTAVEAAAEADRRYRRFPPLLAMLRVFADQVADGGWGREGLTILHYGY